MTATDLIARLHGVRECGSGRWRARCPACDSTNATVLAVTETSDGVVLLKCFREDCTAEAIAQAVGLDTSDLFPPRTIEAQGWKEQRRRKGARPPRMSCPQVADAIAVELLEVMLLITGIHRRGSVTDAEHARLLVAINRVSIAHRELSHV